MLLWQIGMRFAARRIPKIIKPRTHAVLDYAVAGGFLLMAARFWKSNRRAAVGSLICGTGAAANAMLTDYPGGVFRLMDYKRHGRIDSGLAAVTAAAPRFLGFDDEPEARFFALQALTETAVTSMSDFDYYERGDDIMRSHELDARLGHPSMVRTGS